MEIVIVNETEPRHLFMSLIQLSPESVLNSMLVETVLNIIQPPRELTLAVKYWPARAPRTKSRSPTEPIVPVNDVEVRPRAKRIRV